ncbi:MAG: hypothetical protein J6O40_01320 [Ruminococcus sp.]|nr:hypothetical protein [Ruminococcus sp.]
MKLRAITAAATALCICLSMAACGKEDDSKESKAEEKNESITVKEIDDAAEKLESDIASESSGDSDVPADAEVPADDNTNGYDYYKLLDAEYDAVGVTSAQSTSKTNGYAIDGKKVYFNYTRDYDPKSDSGEIIPLSWKTSAVDYAKEEGISTEEVLEEDRSTSDTLDICSYDIESKKYDVTASIVYENTLINDLWYLNGYCFVDMGDSNLEHEMEICRINMSDQKVDMFDLVTSRSENAFGRTRVDNYYVIAAPLSDGSVLLYTPKIKDKIRYTDEADSFYLLDKDFSNVTEIPTPEKDGTHGVTWDGKDAVIYDGRIYAPSLGIYYDTASKKWNTLTDKEFEIKNHIAAGKYLMTNSYLLDMETNEFIIESDRIDLLDPVERTSTGYYGGDHLIGYKGSDKKLYNIQVPSDPSVGSVQSEAMDIEWDKETNFILSDEYYLVIDEFGIFLRSFSNDGEETIKKN